MRTLRHTIAATCAGRVSEHRLASSVTQLPPHTLKPLFDFGRIRMRSREFILKPPTVSPVFFGLGAVAEIEGDWAVNLFEAERGIVCSDRLRRFSILEFIKDESEWHAATDELEAPFPSFNKILHACATLSHYPFSLGVAGRRY
jgi:hypothetical protein